MAELEQPSSGDPLRLRRADRRAQCRQVDADQCAGRHQGRDRLPQGADDARAAARHRDRGRRAAHLRRYARHLRAEAAARPRHGDDRLDGRARRRHRLPCWSMPQRGLDEEADAILAPARRRSAQPKILVLNKVDLVDKPALLALAQGRQRAGEIRRDLHDLGAHRRRRRRRQALARRARAAGTVALSRGPDHRRAAAPAGGRDHAREALSAPAPGAAVSVHGRDRAVEGAARTARSGSSRRSMSSARASARSCSARAAQTIKAIGADARREIAEMIEAAGAPVPVRQGARALGRRSGTLPRRWGWSFRRNERCSGPTKASCSAARRHGEAQRHPRTDDVRAWPPSRPGARRGGLAAAAGAAARQPRQLRPGGRGSTSISATTRSRRSMRARRRSCRSRMPSTASPISPRSAACCRSAIRIRRSMRRWTRCSTACSIRATPARSVVRFELQLLARARLRARSRAPAR